MICITSRKDGFRRCGVAHPAAKTEYADDHFDDEQLAALKAEPMLLVEIVDDKSKGEKKPKDENPGK